MNPPMAGSASWDTGQPDGTPGQQGWTPPTAPTLFPLRPLGLGDVLGATFKLLRTSPGAGLGSAMILTGVTTVLAAVLPLIILIQTLNRATMSDSSDAATIVFGGALLYLLALIPVGVVSLLAQVLLQVIVVQIVGEAAQGRKLTFRAAWGRAWSRTWALVGYTLLYGLGALVVIGIAVGVFFVVLLLVLRTTFESIGASQAPTAGSVLLFIAVVLLLGGALSVGLAWIGIKLLVAPSAIVLEGLGPIAAIRRSWTLTRGRFWPLFGTYVLFNIIVNVAVQGISQVIALVLSISIGIIAPTGSAAEDQTFALTLLVIVLTLLGTALTVVTAAVTLLLQTGIASILYVDLRMRKEGLNLRLQQVLDDDAAGRPSEDPFRAPPLAPQPSGYPAYPPSAGPWQYGAPAPQAGPPPFGTQQPPAPRPPYGAQPGPGLQDGAPQYGAPGSVSPQYGSASQYGAPPPGSATQYGAPQYGSAPQYGAYAPHDGAPPYGAPRNGEARSGPAAGRGPVGSAAEPDEPASPFDARRTYGAEDRIRPDEDSERP